jgi:thiol:disulfide interchange protein
MATQRALFRDIALAQLVSLVLGALFPLSVLAQTTEMAGGPEEPAGAMQPGVKLAATTKLTWQKDLEQSLEMARRAKKMVLVDVYTDWCGWCHKLDRDTYSNPEVITFVNSQFVCLKIDAEDGGQGERFARNHRVKAFPCTLLLDASGNKVGAFYGYRSAQQFPAAVREAIGKG